jgi:hypothetical protein
MTSISVPDIFYFVGDVTKIASFATRSHRVSWNRLESRNSGLSAFEVIGIGNIIDKDFTASIRPGAHNV